MEEEGMTEQTTKQAKTADEELHPLTEQRGPWKWLRATAPELGHETWSAFKLIVVLLVICGVAFPLVVFALGQVAFHDQANGSLILDAQGHVIGSKLLGQQFMRPEYFHGRPSVGSYDASNSGGSNIGPTNPQLIEGNGSQVTVAQGTPPPFQV